MKLRFALRGLAATCILTLTASLAVADTAEVTPLLVDPAVHVGLDAAAKADLADALNLEKHAEPAAIAASGSRFSSDGVYGPSGEAGHDHHDHGHTPGASGYVYSGGRADGHAPIGVMGDHAHKAGEWMLSYRYMYMRMRGNRDGTSDVSNADVLGDFIVTPTDMDMDMHMFGGMYAPTDWVTLMVMIPYVRKSMHHIRRDGVEFDTVSEGIGDVSLTGLFPIYRHGHHDTLAKLGMSFPTGSIDEKDTLPAPIGRAVLPYPMQIGSGTFDLRLGVGHTYQVEKWSLGGQLNGVVRLGENDQDYRLGHRFGATGWFAYKWVRQWSTSVRLDFQYWGDIHGADDRIARFGPGGPSGPPLVPTAQPDLRAGQRLDLLFGTNFYITDGTFKGLRFAIEGGLPIYQDLDGPQLETDFLITFGIQYAF